MANVGYQQIPMYADLSREELRRLFDTTMDQDGGTDIRVYLVAVSRRDNATIRYYHVKIEVVAPETMGVLKLVRYVKNKISPRFRHRWCNF